MESICLSNGFIYSLMGIWICETGKAASDLSPVRATLEAGVFAALFVAVFGAEQDVKAINARVNRYSNLMNRLVGEKMGANY